MKNPILILLLCFVSFGITAQITDTLNQKASPKNGLNQLAIKYYGIEFSKAQRKALEDVEIEFIFSIDEVGKPTLSEVNGISDPAIIDSLFNKTKEVDNFNPRITNGVPEPAIYFMRLTFPAYRVTPRSLGILQGRSYNEAELEDFEYIDPSGQRLDLVIGGLVNQFIGRPAEHLSFGGGMKMDINYTTKNGMYYGLNLSFAQNGLRKDYPIDTQNEQTSPVSGFVGLSVGKWFSRYSLQFDLNLAVHNITERMGDDDEDWVQLNGWSPGIILHYPILLGKERPVYYYGSPSLTGNYLNLSLGLRYVDHSLREASGLMLELGVSYRLAVKGVKRYKLKEDFAGK